MRARRVTRFVADVTRFGAAVVQLLRARTCAACAARAVFVRFLADPDRNCRGATSTRFGGRCFMPRRRPFGGRPLAVHIRTVRHLQSIASSTAKALTPIGISTRLPRVRAAGSPWAAPSREQRGIATAAHEARIRPSPDKCQLVQFLHAERDPRSCRRPTG
jgi:hypothetical protein